MDMLESNPIAQAGKTEETRQWAVLLHLSTLLGFVVPLLGFICIS